MKDISLKDEYGDELEFSYETQGGIIAITRCMDADERLRVGIVQVSEAQARELYLWLAKAIGVIE